MLDLLISEGEDDEGGLCCSFPTKWEHTKSERDMAEITKNVRLATEVSNAASHFNCLGINLHTHRASKCLGIIIFKECKTGNSWKNRPLYQHTNPVYHASDSVVVFGGRGRLGVLTNEQPLLKIYESELLPYFGAFRETPFFISRRFQVKLKVVFRCRRRSWRSSLSIHYFRYSAPAKCCTWSNQTIRGPFSIWENFSARGKLKTTCPK